MLGIQSGYINVRNDFDDVCDSPLPSVDFLFKNLAGIFQVYCRDTTPEVQRSRMRERCELEPETSKHQKGQAANSSRSSTVAQPEADLHADEVTSV
jgi:hypothetical protein